MPPTKQKETTSALYWLGFLISPDPRESLSYCGEHPSQVSAKFQVLTLLDSLLPDWCFLSLLWKSLFSLKPDCPHGLVQFRFLSLSLDEVRAMLHIHVLRDNTRRHNAAPKLHTPSSQEAHFPYSGHDKCV